MQPFPAPELRTRILRTGGIWASNQFRESLRELLRFSHKLGRECHSENCSENAPEFRELLREWPFSLRERFFFKIGVVPRFLNGVKYRSGWFLSLCSCDRSRRKMSWKRRKMLGWHVCRMKLARKIAPEGPNLEKDQSRLNAWKLQSRLKVSILTLRSPHQNRGLVGGSLEIFNLVWKFQSFQSRLKISISCSNPDFFKIWALWMFLSYECSKARKPWSANRELRGWQRRGLSRQVSRGVWKRRINRELEAKMAHKPWIREGPHREAQTMN